MRTSLAALYRASLPMMVLALFSAIPACTTSTVAPAEVLLTVQPVVTGLASPVHLAAPAGDARLFIVEQPGRIRVVKNGQLLATPFLDLTSRVKFGGEQGLLSMAFDPQYVTNGYFYVYYTSQPNGDIVVERFRNGPRIGGLPDSDVASSTPTAVITIPHPGASNHNGGLVAFGPDAMLYLGTGDGGGGGDPSGNGQNLNVLLGKLLRLDVRTLPYTIPSGNPYIGQAGRRDEIWASGLRNPWRFTFDRSGSPATLHIADVGQNRYEEVHVALASAAGLNYGWNRMEGLHCYPSGDTCSKAGLEVAAVEFDHSTGACSITGGHVYRGSAIPEIDGLYFYSDYCAGFLASIPGGTGVGASPRTWSIPNVGNVTSFGEDGARELYMLSANGSVYRIMKG